MDKFIADRTARPSARQKRDIAVEALAADRTSGRLNLQGLGFNALFDASPSHRAHSIDKPNPSCKREDRPMTVALTPLRGLC